MIGRQQLAVASPIAIGDVLGAFVRSAGVAGREIARARAAIERAYEPQRLVLADSGTSALVLALRMLVPRGGVVGFPGYACVDLAAAARFAGVRVRLYDVDPATLGPDLESVHAMMRRGVDAVVVAHLFGFPADVRAVREIVGPSGIPVIEDAAQGAGGLLDGRPLGSHGDVGVLSFGRGKGMCAGGGGALLAFSDRWTSSFDTIDLAAGGRGWGALAKTAVQWGLGRPSLYGLPSMLPFLHLGEMVYHPATEPRAMAAGSLSLLPSAIALQACAAAGRAERAATLMVTASNVDGLAPATVIEGGQPGYLRLPVRDVGESRQPNLRLGVLRPYPRTLAEQAELTPILESGEPPIPGATSLRRTLFTLPTHHFVTSSDVRALAAWMGSNGRPSNQHAEAFGARAEHDTRSPA